MRKIIVLTWLGLAALIAGVAVLLLSARPWDGARVMGPEFALLDDPGTAVQGARGVEMGDPDAPITIIEFGDFQCPACGAFSADHKARVVEVFVETGRARFVYYDMPLTSVHPNALEAARAARCAGDQGGYWAYHDRLYREQTEWSPLPDPRAAFIGYAADGGLDADVFLDCVTSGRHEDAVAADLALADELGIGGTPTILVRTHGGVTVRASGYTFDAVAQAFREVADRVDR